MNYGKLLDPLSYGNFNILMVNMDSNLRIA